MENLTYSMHLLLTTTTYFQGSEYILEVLILKVSQLRGCTIKYFKHECFAVMQKPCLSHYQVVFTNTTGQGKRSEHRTHQRLYSLFPFLIYSMFPILYTCYSLH